MDSQLMQSNQMADQILNDDEYDVNLEDLVDDLEDDSEIEETEDIEESEETSIITPEIREMLDSVERDLLEGLETELDFSHPEFWQNLTLDDLQDFINLSNKVKVEPYEEIDYHKSVEWVLDEKPRYKVREICVARKRHGRLKKSSILHTEYGDLPVATIEGEDIHDLLIEAIMSYMFWCERWEITNKPIFTKYMLESLRVIRRLIRVRLKEIVEEREAISGSKQIKIKRK